MEEMVAFVDKHYRAICFALAAIGGGFLVYLIIIMIVSSVKSETFVVFSFAPTSAVLRIDDKEYRTGSYEFLPGSYSGTLSSGSDFEEKKIDFEVKKGETISVDAYVRHNSLGMHYFEKNKSDLNVLRMMKDDEAIDAFLDEYDRKYSIMATLPLGASFRENGVIYDVSISDGYEHKNCDTTLCLLVSGEKIDKDLVVSAVSQNGYNINDYKMIYENN